MKGFTLIELLAVIVILAIILLIAMPVINNVIEGVKKSAFESSVKNIIKSGEYTYASNMFKPNRELVYTFENSEITGNYPEAKLDFSGEVPKSGNVIVREDGKIAASLFNGEYCAVKDYDTNNVTIVDKGIDDCYSEISLPEVTLNGSDSINIEINTTYTDLGVVAKTIGGEDITTIETKIFKDNDEVPSIDTSSIGTYRIIYTVYEKSKTNFTERTVVVRDTTKPVLTAPTSTSITINEVNTFDFLNGVSVTDNSLETLAIQVSGSISRIAGSYAITYSATDSSGNTEEVIRIINVNDIEAPVITLNGAQVININVGGTYTELNAASIDDADGNLTSTIVKSGSVNTNTPGTYFITYTSTDSSNNESSITRTINIIDSIAPVVTLIGQSTINIVVGTAYTELGATSLDNYDGNITGSILISGSINTNVAGTYYMTYTSRDSSNNETNIQRTIIVDSIKVIQIAAGNMHTLFLMNNGTVRAVGSNTYGQLGDGTNVGKQNIITIPGLVGVKQISAGAFHSVFLMENGTVKSTGYNGMGGLGIGSTTNVNVPTNIAGLSDIKKISAGDYHTLFLTTPGVLSATGSNQFYQLGNGTNVDRNIPTYITSLVKDIYAGTTHSVIITTDGTTKGVGSNTYGHFGIGVAYSGGSLTNFTNLYGSNVLRTAAVRGAHSLYFKMDGTVQSSGYNNKGQLGHNSTTQYFDYTNIPGISNVKQIGVGGTHSVILLNNGTVKVSGSGAAGQLGISSSDIQSFELIPSITDVKDIFVGDNNTFFLLNNGTVKATGSNGDGQLGDGTKTNRYTPVTITVN